MSLILFSNPLVTVSHFPSSSSSSSSSSSFRSTFSFTATPVSRLHVKPIDLHTKSFNGIQFRDPIRGKKIGSAIVKASADMDGTSPTGNSIPEPASETKEGEAVPFEKMPLESKLQERMEQKMRMKLAKKIRLRRKRLLRKRRMRKKGRWPPSKMKKLKNV